MGEELGERSRVGQSDDTMLSIWTASTLSIACGSIEPFKREPTLHRSLSCSALVTGKSLSNLNKSLFKIESKGSMEDYRVP